LFAITEMPRSKKRRVVSIKGTKKEVSKVVAGGKEEEEEDEALDSEAERAEAAYAAKELKLFRRYQKARFRGPPPTDHPIKQVLRDFEGHRFPSPMADVFKRVKLVTRNRADRMEVLAHFEAECKRIDDALRPARELADKGANLERRLRIAKDVFKTEKKEWRLPNEGPEDQDGRLADFNVWTDAHQGQEWRDEEQKKWEQWEEKTAGEILARRKRRGSEIPAEQRRKKILSIENDRRRT
jgi:hypothetical protein